MNTDKKRINVKLEETRKHLSITLILITVNSDNESTGDLKIIALSMQPQTSLIWQCCGDQLLPGGRSIKEGCSILYSTRYFYHWLIKIKEASLFITEVSAQMFVCLEYLKTRPWALKFLLWKRHLTTSSVSIKQP